MRKLFAVLILCVSWSASAEAQELLLAQTTPPRLEWSYQGAPDCTLATPTIDVQSSQTFVGTYTRVAQLPITATVYALPSVANNLYYRVATACGESNIVQYVAAVPPPTGPTLEQRMTTIETRAAELHLAIEAVLARLTALETEVPPVPPAPASNFTVTVIDANHIRVVCNGTAIDTTGRGTQRVLECIQ